MSQDFLNKQLTDCLTDQQGDFHIPLKTSSGVGKKRMQDHVESKVKLYLELGLMPSRTALKYQTLSGVGDPRAVQCMVTIWPKSRLISCGKWMFPNVGLTETIRYSIIII